MVQRGLISRKEYEIHIRK